MVVEGVTFKLFDGSDPSIKWRTPVVDTLEGEMRVSPGDWIITGVKGERYPCKPDVFVATYEPAEEDESDGEATQTAGADENG